MVCIFQASSITKLSFVFSKYGDHGFCPLLPIFENFLFLLFVWGVCVCDKSSLRHIIYVRSHPLCFKIKSLTVLGFDYLGWPAGPLSAFLALESKVPLSI